MMTRIDKPDRDAQLRDRLQATINEEKAEQARNHAMMSWTACYDDYCSVHLSDKQGSGWYPTRPRGQLNVIERRPLQLVSGNSMPVTPPRLRTEEADLTENHTTVFTWLEATPEEPETEVPDSPTLVEGDTINPPASKVPDELEEESDDEFTTDERNTF